MNLKRKEAARLIEQIAIAVAGYKSRHGSYQEQAARGEALANLIEAALAAKHVKLPEECHGEAHSNAYIDNCMVCAPEWGWILDKITIR